MLDPLVVEDGRHATRGNIDRDSVAMHHCTRMVHFKLPAADQNHRERLKWPSFVEGRQRVLEELNPKELSSLLHTV